jgi:ADP-ribosylation factor-like protein 2
LFRISGATLLIFANKQDLPGSLSPTEISEALQLSTMQTHHWQILPCCALNGEHLLEGIDWLVDDIAGRVFCDD